MPHISRRKLSNENQQLLNDATLWMFSSLSKPQVLSIFSTLLTPTERVMVAKRLGILFLLKENQLESAIAEILRVTPNTVSRIKMQSNLTPSTHTEFLFKKLSSWQRFNLFKKILISVALQIAKNLSRGFTG